MRSLPRVVKKGCDPSEWYFDFLDACRNDSANRTIPEFVDPDYRVRMGRYFLLLLNKTRTKFI